jgi:hypothetical protein
MQWRMTKGSHSHSAEYSPAIRGRISKPYRDARAASLSHFEQLFAMTARQSLHSVYSFGLIKAIACRQTIVG